MVNAIAISPAFPCASSCLENIYLKSKSLAIAGIDAVSEDNAIALKLFLYLTFIP